MGQGLPRPCGFHLPCATVFAYVAGLREVWVVFASLAGEFIPVRSEFVSGFLKFGGHTDSLC